MNQKCVFIFTLVVVVLCFNGGAYAKSTTKEAPKDAVGDDLELSTEHYEEERYLESNNSNNSNNSNSNKDWLSDVAYNQSIGLFQCQNGSSSDCQKMNNLVRMFFDGISKSFEHGVSNSSSSNSNSSSINFDEQPPQNASSIAVDGAEAEADDGGDDDDEESSSESPLVHKNAKVLMKNKKQDEQLYTNASLIEMPSPPSSRQRRDVDALDLGNSSPPSRLPPSLLIGKGNINFLLRNHLDILASLTNPQNLTSDQKVLLYYAAVLESPMVPQIVEQINYDSDRSSRPSSFARSRAAVKPIPGLLQTPLKCVLPKEIVELKVMGKKEPRSPLFVKRLENLKLRLKGDSKLFKKAWFRRLGYTDSDEIAAREPLKIQLSSRLSPYAASHPDPTLTKIVEEIEFTKVITDDQVTDLRRYGIPDNVINQTMYDYTKPREGSRPLALSSEDQYDIVPLRNGTKGDSSSEEEEEEDDAPSGEKGLKGDKGLKGEPALKGEKGEKGVVGDKGAKGVPSKLAPKASPGLQRNFNFMRSRSKSNGVLSKLANRTDNSALDSESEEDYEYVDYEEPPPSIHVPIVDIHVVPPNFGEVVVNVSAPNVSSSTAAAAAAADDSSPTTSSSPTSSSPTTVSAPTTTATAKGESTVSSITVSGPVLSPGVSAAAAGVPGVSLPAANGPAAVSRPVAGGGRGNWRRVLLPHRSAGRPAAGGPAAAVTSAAVTSAAVTASNAAEVAVTTSTAAEVATGSPGLKGEPVYKIN